MAEYHILNLGAGVQSTCLYLMSMKNEAPRFDLAIFADTQEEPVAVYEHLKWMQSLNGPEIMVRSAGKLGDDLMQGVNWKGDRFVGVPAYTLTETGEKGRGKRQCSSDYKIKVIDRAIRRDVLSLKPKQRIPRGITVHQYFGISFDEKSRASRIWERFHIQKSTRMEPHFPLVERMLTRANCIEWLIAYGVPHQVPRSACVFCPFHTDAEWQQLKDAGGADWERATQIDEAMRKTGVIVNRNTDAKFYLHRACSPLVEINFHPRPNVKEQQLGFAFECEGVCGV